MALNRVYSVNNISRFSAENEKFDLSPSARGLGCLHCTDSNTRFTASVYSVSLHDPVYVQTFMGHVISKRAFSPCRMQARARGATSVESCIQLMKIKVDVDALAYIIRLISC